MFKNIVIAIIVLCITSLSLSQNLLKIVEAEGCNLAIDEVLDNDIYVLSNISKVPNWFSGVFEGIDTGVETSFSVMAGMGYTKSKGDVKKWEGLRPVYTYAKYLDYNSYIYYTKNKDGYWVSSDPFLNDEERLAGNGKTPFQTIIPADLSEEFLSEDNNYWSPWAELKTAYPLAFDNTFHITHKFNSSDVSIAMKYPYTYDYEEEYMNRLKAADMKGVTVNEVGKSIKEHNLYVVTVCDPKATEEELYDRRVVLIYGNEDGDEPDSSWTVDGAMSYFIRGLQDDDKKVLDILKEVTFLFIPLLDPVGWSECTYSLMTNRFLLYGVLNSPENLIPPNPTETKYTIKFDDDFFNERSEVRAYAKFINKWVINGHRLDIVCNLHNVECAEGPNFFCPLIDISQGEMIMDLNEIIFSGLVDFKTSDEVWMKAFINNRFMSWCAEIYGSIQVPYEINSRYPDNRLNLQGMGELGKSLALSFSTYFDSEEYERALPNIDMVYAKHLLRTEEFFATHGVNDENIGSSPEQRNFQA